MWNPSIIKKIWPQWRIKSTIKEDETGVLYEVEEKGLGEMNKARIVGISLSPHSPLFERIRERPEFGETSFNHVIGETLQKLNAVLKRLKEGSLYAPILTLQDSELYREEDGLGWHLLLRQDLLPSLNEFHPRLDLTHEAIIKLGIDLAKGLDFYEELGLEHGEFHGDNVYVSPMGEYTLGEIDVYSYLKKNLPYEYGKELIPYQAGAKRSGVYSLASFLSSLLSKSQGYGTSPEKTQALQRLFDDVMQEDSRYKGAYDLRRALQNFDGDGFTPMEMHHEPSPPSTHSKTWSSQQEVKKKGRSALPLVFIGFIVLGLLAFAITRIFHFGNAVDVSKIPQIENRQFVAVEKGEDIEIIQASGTKIRGRYFGEMEKGKPHGKGAFMAFDDQNPWVYSGEWKEGVYHGYGKSVDKDGSYYFEGLIQDGVAQGKGFIYDANFGEYEGDFEKDLFHGKGCQRFNNGDTYEGDYQHDYRHGKGEYTWSTGDKYTGDFVQNKLEGKGRLIYQDQGIYEGDFVDGLRHGKGIYQWPSGDVYEGDWVEGNKEGRGTMAFATGDVYEGDFLKGLYHGKGTMVWSDGTVYTGDWLDGKAHGQGEESREDGSVYRGEFKEGYISGYGTKNYAVGDVYEGQWEKDQRHGEGTYTWANGDKFVGQFVDGMREGEGILYDPQGNIVRTGRWEKDEYVGE